MKQFLLVSVGNYFWSSFLLAKRLVIKMNCDLCGKVEDNLVKASIEGVELDVCQNCGKFGKVIVPIHRPSPKEQHRQFQKQTKVNEKEEKTELLVENYAELIKKKRESMRLSQKDFASKANEKESTIHHIETGKLEPNLALARKLGRLLGIKIIEEYSETNEPVKTKKSNGFTLGDFIRVKK